MDTNLDHLDTQLSQRMERCSHCREPLAIAYDRKPSGATWATYICMEQGCPMFGRDQ